MYRYVLLILVLVLGFAIRMIHLQNPPLDFNSTRQYRSIILTRAIFLDFSPSTDLLSSKLAEINRESEGPLEPPVMEYISAVAYRLVGQEVLWIPRLLSILPWLLSGYILYLLASRFFSFTSAIIALSLFLFIPFGIVASRSFQPESLMLLFLLLSLLSILQYFDSPSMVRLVRLLLVAALAILIKPTCVFLIGSVFLIYNFTSPRSVKQRIGVALAFLFISLTPPILYYLNTIQTHAPIAMYPHFWLEGFYWKGWFNQIITAIGYIGFLGGVVGMFVVMKTKARVLMMGLLFGYLIFGLTYSYHIHTHNYYQLMLLPILALALAPLIEIAVRRIKSKFKSGNWFVISFMIAGLSLGMGSFVALHQHVNNNLNQEQTATFKTIGSLFGINFVTISFLLPHAEYEILIDTFEEIGEHVGHSTRTIFLTMAYGKPLKYHGNLYGKFWPGEGDFRFFQLQEKSPLPAEERYHSMYEKHQPEYFIITNFYEYDKQPDLQKWLTSGYPILKETEEYLIFDMRK